MSELLVIYQAPFSQTAMGFRQGADYRIVWTELTDSRDVEGIWARFQRVEPGIQMPPDGYTGRSLSIGDVISIGRTMLTPLGLGWRELDPEERKSVLRSASSILSAEEV